MVRPAASPDGAEGLSVDRAFRAIRRCDVVGLVIDAVDGITQQDFRRRPAPPRPRPLVLACLGVDPALERGQSPVASGQSPVVTGRGPCRLAELVQAEGRACVIIVNKWDLVPDKANTSPPPSSLFSSSFPAPTGAHPEHGAHKMAAGGYCRTWHTCSLSPWVPVGPSRSIKITGCAQAVDLTSHPSHRGLLWLQRSIGMGRLKRWRCSCGH